MCLRKDKITGNSILKSLICMTSAVLVIDMVNDFVYGKLGSEMARGIVEPLQELLTEAESRGIPIILSQDSHVSSDPEMDVWGEHAMRGDEGAATIEDLDEFSGIKVPKRFYDSFHDTDLYRVLNQRDADEVILTGVTTDICIQHTAAGAFFRGFDVTVVSDCTAAVTEEKHERALEYMDEIYGADIKRYKKIVKGWK